jgi:multidrug efflux system membrane fusion protein
MKKIIIGGIIILVLATAGALAWRSNHQTLEAVNLHTGPIVQAVYATGTVEPTIMIPIAPRMSARLMGISAEEGDKVKKGALLAQLEDTDILKNLDGLRSQAEAAERELTRQDDLIKRKATSILEQERAKANRDAAVAAVEQAEAQLSFMKLSAPEDGLIIKRDGEMGEIIPMGQPVFWMSCCAPLRIAAEVDEEDISLVVPGQKVLISADAFPSQVFEGTVQSITPKGDPVARSYRVRIALPAETPLMIGMTAEANIITRENKNALLAPPSSVRDNKIWVVENDIVKIIDVKTGIRSPDAIEIAGGVDNTSIVLQQANTTLKDGDRIKTQIQSWQAH